MNKCYIIFSTYFFICTALYIAELREYLQHRCIIVHKYSLIIYCLTYIHKKWSCVNNWYWKLATLTWIKGQFRFCHSDIVNAVYLLMDFIIYCMWHRYHDCLYALVIDSVQIQVCRSISRDSYTAKRQKNMKLIS